MCEIMDAGNTQSPNYQLSDDELNFLVKRSIKVGTVREFLTYLKTRTVHFNNFLILFEKETKQSTCDFLDRFKKIPPHLVYELIFDKNGKSEACADSLYKRIIYILSSDIDLLVASLYTRNQESLITDLTKQFHIVFNHSIYRNIQPFFDALRKDIIGSLLKNNPESYILSYIEQLKNLVIRSDLGSEGIRLFGKTAMSASSLYIYNFLDSHKLILTQRRNSTLFTEILANYFRSKEYCSEIPPLISEVPKMVHKIVLEGFINGKEIELFIHEVSIYLRLMDKYKDYIQTEKVLQLAHSFKVCTPDTSIGKLLWSMITDMFLCCEKEDFDWLYSRFENSITKNFFRKLIQNPVDQIYSLARLIKAYYLFKPINNNWKCKTNKEFFDWLFSQPVSEKLELMIDICGVLATKVQSNHLIGLFFYLALYERRLYRILLGHCNIYRLQSLNRDVYINALYQNMNPLIEALRKIATKLVIRSNPYITQKNEYLQNLLHSSYELNCEDKIYESLCKISDPRLFEAYCKHVQTTIQYKGSRISFEDCKYDFYKVRFHEVKKPLEKIIKKLLGPISLIPSKDPNSSSRCIQIPEYIDYYYDSKRSYQTNRNVIYYKGYVVREASKHLAHSDFLTLESFKGKYKYPSVYFKIYSIFEEFRCETLFKQKYSRFYPTEIDYLNTYNSQTCDRFYLLHTGFEDILNLMSLYSKYGYFCKSLMTRQEIRDFLYSPLFGSKHSVAEWIQYQFKTLFKINVCESNESVLAADALYSKLVLILSNSNEGEQLTNFTLETENQEQVTTPRTKISKDVSSLQSLEHAYADFYKFLQKNNSKIERAIEHHYHVSDRIPETPMIYRAANQLTARELSSWNSLHELIDSYKI